MRSRTCSACAAREEAGGPRGRFPPRRFRRGALWVRTEGLNALETVPGVQVRQRELHRGSLHPAARRPYRGQGWTLLTARRHSHTEESARAFLCNCAWQPPSSPELFGPSARPLAPRRADSLERESSGFGQRKLKRRTVKEVRGTLASAGRPKMKTLPEGLRVARCMRCREPINQPIGVDGRSATHCARCAPTPASRENRIDRIRAAALAAQAARMRAPLPLPNRSGRRHV